MSFYPHMSEAHRRQAEEDHRVIWNITNKDPATLAQLGPTQPGIFHHFLLQGDLLDEALQIMQELRRQEQERDRVVTSQWQARWQQAEGQQQRWRTPEGRSSVLNTPARIDMRDHEDAAWDAPLNYLGEDTEAPVGTVRQRARWAAKVASEMQAMQDGRREQQVVPMVPMVPQLQGHRQMRGTQTATMVPQQTQMQVGRNGRGIPASSNGGGQDVSNGRVIPVSAHGIQQQGRAVRNGRGIPLSVYDVVQQGGQHPFGTATYQGRPN